MNTMDKGTIDMFLAIRPRLFSIGLHVLGNRADAEDVVQETWIRWQATDPGTIRRPDAFLSTVTTRLALNLATDAAHRLADRRVHDIPEPMDTVTPEDVHERHAAIDRCLLVILLTLAPRERAAFLLREAFEVTYAEIARLTGQAEPAVRQVVSRARRKLRTPCANPVDVKEHRELVWAFRHATSTGDRRPLDRILCLWASGGAAPEFALAS